MGGGNGGYCGAAGLGSRVEAPDRDWGSELRSAAGFGAWLQGCGRIMCEGPSRISGPIPPDPTLCPDYYRRPASGELRGPAAGKYTAPPLSTAFHCFLLLSPRSPGRKRAEAGPADFRSRPGLLSSSWPPHQAWSPRDPRAWSARRGGRAAATGGHLPWFRGVS